MKKLKLSLTTQITIALVLAVIAGILLQDYPLVANEYIKPFGVIFLNLLKFIVAPLVLFSIMSGILSMNDMSNLSKLGLRSVFYFCITTIIAVTLGLLISTFAKGLIPTVSINMDGSAASNANSTVPTFMDQLVNIVHGELGRGAVQQHGHDSDYLHRSGVRRGDSAYRRGRRADKETDIQPQ